MFYNVLTDIFSVLPSICYNTSIIEAADILNNSVK